MKIALGERKKNNTSKAVPCEIRLVVETMLKNIRCFIVFIVILMLGSVRKQGIVFSYFALEYEVKKIK